MKSIQGIRAGPRLDLRGAMLIRRFHQPHPLCGVDAAADAHFGRQLHNDRCSAMRHGHHGLLFYLYHPLCHTTNAQFLVGHFLFY